MKVLDSQKAESVNTLIQDNDTSDIVVFTDQGKNYQDIHKYINMHITEKSSKQTSKTTQKWAHIAISNAKKTFLGVYHKMSSDYLQNFLNEFAYEQNMRNFAELYERVIIAAVFPYWYECA